MRRQRGATGLMIMVIIALVGTVLAAMWLVKRLGDTSADRDETTRKMEAGAAALESFVASLQRLPCPADPAADDGTEVRGVTGDCGKPKGTLPWKTIGLAREQAFDAWGRKISYRVYRGTPAGIGSLTQDNGASMANCDTNEAFPSGVSGNGLCKPDPVDNNPASRSTTPAQFLAGKGLNLNYFGKDVTSEHVAYILISHGPTGLGGYTVAGTALDDPVSPDERSNLSATAATTYVARGPSGPDVGVKNNDFFDDLLIYRTIEDLAKRANLAARNWPDDVTGAATFDKATVEAAVGGGHITGGDTQRTSIQFNTVTVSAFAAGTAQNISLKSTGPGQDGIGGAAGDGALSSDANEMLRLDFVESSRRFAFTLQNFGYEETTGPSPIPTWVERVEITFFNVSGTTATQIGSPIVKVACASGDALASFNELVPSVTGQDFNRVEIRPLASTVYNSETHASSFVLSEVRTCTATAVITCQTGLESANPTSHCS